MKWFTFMAVPAMALALATPVTAGEDDHYLTVTGNGVVSAQPDEGYFNTGVQTHHRFAASAFNENAHKVTVIFRALNDVGVTNDNIQTSQLVLREHWKSVPTGEVDQHGNKLMKQVKDGFIAYTSLRITVCELPDFGRVLDAAVSNGATDVGSISFGASDAKAKLELARAAAAEDALKRATVYAKGFGIELAQPVVISEGGSYRNELPGYSAKSADTRADMPVSGGSLTFSANVTVRWKLD